MDWEFHGFVTYLFSVEEITNHVLYPLLLVNACSDYGIAPLSYVCLFIYLRFTLFVFQKDGIEVLMRKERLAKLATLSGDLNEGPKLCNKVDSIHALCAQFQVSSLN